MKLFRKSFSFAAIMMASSGQNLVSAAPLFDILGESLGTAVHGLVEGTKSLGNGVVDVSKGAWDGTKKVGNYFVDGTKEYVWHPIRNAGSDFSNGWNSGYNGQGRYFNDPKSDPQLLNQPPPQAWAVPASQNTAFPPHSIPPPMNYGNTAIPSPTYPY